ncbi:MAG: TIGR01212 family radical SAM protein [Bacilli bacterium]|nr:TIGR01212 family radical SAM protein [Bacilli bacterium]
MYKYSDSNKRYYTLDYFYKHKFNSKVFKVSLNAGFSCPNFDGSLSSRGCIYCSETGSGEYAGDVNDDLVKQFNKVKEVINHKWPNSKYIGYFQARSNTYAPLSVLKEKYESILNLDNVVGLSIATRPDCISKECYNYLEELSKKTYLTVEIGLQSINEDTLKLINRCHDVKCFDKCINELRKRNINVVVHIINGLPYETKEDMINTVKHLNGLDIQGLKIHMLHIIKNTELERLYNEAGFKVLSKDEYVDIVCDQLEYIKDDIVINRITADPKIDDLVEPTWLVRKFDVLNSIDKEMKKRDSYQGIRYKKEA